MTRCDFSVKRLWGLRTCIFDQVITWESKACREGKMNMSYREGSASVRRGNLIQLETSALRAGSHTAQLTSSELHYWTG